MKLTIYIKGRNWTFQLAESLLRSDNLNYLVTDYPKFYVKKYKAPSNKVKSFTFLYILQRIMQINS